MTIEEALAVADCRTKTVGDDTSTVLAAEVRSTDAAIAMLIQERDAARAEAARLRALFLEMLENYLNDVGDAGFETYWKAALEGSAR